MTKRSIHLLRKKNTHLPLILAIAIFLDLRSVPALSQQDDKIPESISHLLERAETFSDIAKSWPGLKELPSTNFILLNAFSEAYQGSGTGETGRAIMSLRLLALAAIQEGPCRANVGSLDKLTPGDVDALAEMTLYPAPSDQIRYLLARFPSLRDQLLGEPRAEYYSVRLQTDADRALVLEKSTIPYLGLGSEFSSRTIASRDDIVSGTLGEHAQTRRFFLSGLVPLIAAAKTASISRCFSNEVHALLVQTVLAVWLAGLSSVDEGAINSFWTVSSSISNKIQKFSQYDFRRIDYVLTHYVALTAYQRQRFETALAAYARLSSNTTVPGLRRVGEWGKAVVELALDHTLLACKAFGNFSNGLKAGEEKYAVVMLRILDNLTDTEKSKCTSDASNAIGNAARLLKPDELSLSPNLDTQISLLQKVGRPDIGVRFYSKALPLVIERRESINKLIEMRYITEIAAFLRDLFSVISFHLTPEDGWQPIPRGSYDNRLDFLHHERPDGSLTKAGEILVLTSGSPYGMGDPERDLATSIAAYGIPSNCPSTGALMRKTNNPSEGASAFAAWVNESMSRNNGSIVPYLKLIWIEWFACSFESLKNAEFDPVRFAFNPASDSGITSIDQVTKLANNSMINLQQRELLDLMIRARVEMSKLYRAR